MQRNPLAAFSFKSCDSDVNAVYLYDVSASAGHGSFDALIQKENIIGRYVIPDFHDISFMIYVKGSSMYPKYSSGDIIACERGFLVKRLRESKKPDHITAVSDKTRLIFQPMRCLVWLWLWVF